MRWLGRQRRLVAAILLLLVSWGGARAGEEGTAPYPVRLTAQFEGGSFEASRDQWAKLLAEEEGIELYRRESPADWFYQQPIGEHERALDLNDLDSTRIRVRQLHSCDQVISALASGFTIDEGFGAPGIRGSEAAVLALTIVECQVIRSVERAKPSARSFLVDFKLNAMTPEVLPWVVSGFGLTLDSSREDIREDAQRRRLSWAAWRREAYCEMARYGDWNKWVTHLDEILRSHGYDPWTLDVDAWRAAHGCRDEPPFGFVPRSFNHATYVEPWSAS